MTARRSRDERFAIWAAARAEANLAYDAWCEAPGRLSYARYLAAEDQADVAERDLAVISELLLSVA